MSGATDSVRKAVESARSTDDLVDDGFDAFEPPPLDSPLDEETLDEQVSTQLGEMWDSRRRDAN